MAAVAGLPPGHVPMAQYGAQAARPQAGQSVTPVANALPKHLQQDLEIQQLADLYQQQLAELNACHSLLTVDQERLASMLAPYVNAQGELVMDAPDPDVLLFKDGLDLRLKEFEEDCKRIQATEAKLQRKIDEATTDYEQAVHGIAMSTDSRIYRRLREQQRLIDLQQQEIDQVRFEKELLQEETRRLRMMTARDQRAAYNASMGQNQSGVPFPRLHETYEARREAPPMEGTSQEVLFAPYGYR
eukprot:TRINITY_DN18779_c0_g5_i1.p1 TRINITY_DN18779_c0_g5~~TRINITY_DN18779_c0_g5_i1.p1  ORF type:complete len:244 (-),score=76.78 TRINITY_DN18779_c0_g5_i1:432-1163(-)